MKSPVGILNYMVQFSGTYLGVYIHQFIKGSKDKVGLNIFRLGLYLRGILRKVFFKRLELRIVKM